jgi:hypothetical protein
MIATPTVFVLGAGASMPYGFPSGRQLASRICQNPFPLPHADLGIDPAEYDAFTADLRMSRQPSVDAFLEHRPKFQDLGKKAIGAFLIRDEEEGRLIQPPDPEKDWYAYILDRMTRDTPFADLHHNKVSFITFNYDRSLEHFLLRATMARYGKTIDEVARALRNIRIVHIHGRLGYLAWHEGANAGNTRAYDTTLTADTIRIAAENIKIVSEYMNEGQQFGDAWELWPQAVRIVILGFGYLHVNMRRLKLPLDSKTVNVIIGTCYGLTGAESGHLCNTYRGLHLHNYESLRLFREMPELQPD